MAPALWTTLARLWREARSRRYFHVLAAYLAASWLILQVTAIFIDKLALPRWFFPAVVLLLLIGLVIITATAFVRPVGAPAEAKPPVEPLATSIRAGRLPHLTWPRALIGGILAFATLALAAVWIVVRRGDERTVSRAATPPERTIAVLPFRTVGEGLDLWREGMVDLLATNLDNAGGLRAINSRTVLNRWRSTVGREPAEGDVEPALRVAQETGAGLAVVGSAVGLGPNVRITVSLHRSGDGQSLAQTRVEGPQDSVLALVDRLSVQILTAVPGRAPVTQARLAALTSESLDALKSFLAGEQAYRRMDLDAAAAAYERAVQLDTTFALALYRLGLVYGWIETLGGPRPLEYSEGAWRHSGRLPERERLFLEANLLLERGRPRAIDLARAAVARYPDDVEAWYLLGEALFHLGGVRNEPVTATVQAFDAALALDSSFAPALVHLIDAHFARSDSAAVVRYVALSGSLGGARAERDRIAYEIAWHGLPPDSALRLLRGDVNALRSFAFRLAVAPTLSSPLIALATEAQRPAYPDAFREIGYRFGGFGYVWRGHAEEAARVWKEGFAETGDWRHRFFRVFLAATGALDPAIVRDELSQLAADTALHGWWLVGAVAAAEGDASRARQVALDLEARSARLRESGDSVGADVSAGLALGLRGMVAAASGDERVAITSLERAIQLMGTGVFHAFATVDAHRFLLASILAEIPDRRQEALRILSTFEVDPFFFDRATLVRARIYEAQGDREAALRDYAGFAERWREADARFQPDVAEARRALERLAGERAS